MHERVFGIIVFIHLHDFGQFYLRLYDCSGENASGEVAAVRDERNICIEAVLQLLQRLAYFRKVLVRKRLVNAQVVVPPTEMRSRSRFYSSSRTSGYGVYNDITFQHQMFCQGQQPQLNAGGETSRIGNVLAMTNGAAVQFGKAVYEVMVFSGNAVIHRQVDYLQVFGQVVAFHKLARVTMCRTEKHHIHFIQWQCIGKGQIGFAIQSFVYIGNLISGIARTVDEMNLHIRVIDKQANQFACCISCSSYNSSFYHTQLLSSGTIIHINK